MIFNCGPSSLEVGENIMKFDFLIFKESLFAFNHLTTLVSSALIVVDGSIFLL